MVVLLQKLLRLYQFRTVHGFLPSLAQFEADLIDDPVTIAQQLHVGGKVVQRLTVDQYLRKRKPLVKLSIKCQNSEIYVRI